MKPIIKRRYLFRRDHDDLSSIYFLISGILFVGYTIDFLIFKDLSFLYVTSFAPLTLGLAYRVRNKR